MGGNALKNTYTRRYNKPEFETISNSVLNTINEKLTVHVKDCAIIPYYRTKDSFGDLDVIYSTYNDLPIVKQQIIDVFSPSEIVVNGSVISFNVEELQVDIIHSKDHVFDYAFNYFSWNDCGNLIGKICHKFGLKHGHMGLTFPLRDGNNKFSEILLCTDYNRTLEFLGLDPIAYQRGFDTLNEMFQFVSSSTYFTPALFAFEAMNATARIRDKKRTTYNGFLEYCDAYTGSVYDLFLENKEEYVPYILTCFPESRMAFADAVCDLNIQRVVKQKFNGSLVSSITLLTGNELGKFIQYLRDLPEFSTDIVLYSSTETIESNIRRLYERYCN
jgi:hypothetical protein